VERKDIDLIMSNQKLFFRKYSQYSLRINTMFNKKTNNNKLLPTENKINWTDKVSAISNAVMVIITLLGAILILVELNVMQEQNKYLNRTLMQSYRPIGVMKYKPKDFLKPITINRIPTKNENEISFVYERNLINRGQGLLVFVGHIYYLTYQQIDFRNIFINDGLNISFDTRYSYTRNEPLLPGDTIEIKTTFSNVRFKNSCFIYIISFYKDQDQNLYDTQNLTVIHFQTPVKYKSSQYIAQMDSLKPGAISEDYHLYNNEERIKLIEQFQKLNHPMWKFL